MNSRFERILPIAAALVVIGVLLARQWQIAGDLAGVPLDDAYIHYRFADNLARGRGFAFNPGEPTPGSTSPLWVFLLAAGELAGLSPILSSKILGGLAFIACAWLTWRLARRLMGKDDSAKLFAIAAGVLVALSGRLAWTALSGMETAAFAAASLLALYQLADHPLDVPTSALLGLAALLRPEGYLLFALVLILSLFPFLSLSKARPIHPSSIVLRPFLNLLTFAIIISPYLIFSFAVTGSPLPNTFRANARELPAAEYLVHYLRYMADDNALLLLLIPFGLFAAWRDRRAWPAAAWAVGFPLVAALLTPNLRHHGRYSIPLIPFYVLVGILGLGELAGRFTQSTSQILRRRLSSGYSFGGGAGGGSPRQRAMLMVVSAALVVGLISTWQWSYTFASDARDIDHMQVAMGRWVADHTSLDAQLALSDIGAIGYLSGRRVVDIVGLVTPDILPAVTGRPVGLERDQAVFDYLARHRPHYVAILPTWYPYLASTPASHLAELHTIRLDHIPSVGGGDHLRIYSTDWSWLDKRAPQHPLAADFGGIIALEGFDLSPGAQISAGSALTLTLTWRDIQPAGRFKVFVHLIDGAGHIAAQEDAEPVGNLWPTNLWRIGDVVRDEHVVVVPAGLLPGTYSLRIGLYAPSSGGRLPIASGGDSVTCAAIEVTP